MCGQEDRAALLPGSQTRVVVSPEGQSPFLISSGSTLQKVYSRQAWQKSLEAPFFHSTSTLRTQTLSQVQQVVRMDLEWSHPGSLIVEIPCQKKWSIPGDEEEQGLLPYHKYGNPPEKVRHCLQLQVKSSGLQDLLTERGRTTKTSIRLPGGLTLFGREHGEVQPILFKNRGDFGSKQLRRGDGRFMRTTV